MTSYPLKPIDPCPRWEFSQRAHTGKACDDVACPDVTSFDASEKTVLNIDDLNGLTSLGSDRYQTRASLALRAAVSIAQPFFAGVRLPVPCNSGVCLVGRGADSPPGYPLPARLIENIETHEVKYRTILLDPPWEYRNKASRGAASKHYPTLSIDELAALPIAGIAAVGAHLHLWVPPVLLPDALTLLKAWTFTYKTHAVWVKQRHFGLGNYWRNQHELLLFATFGRKPIPFARHDIPSVITARSERRHSSKPDIFYELIEAVSLPPRIELFARRTVPGWDAFGNDIQHCLF